MATARFAISEGLVDMVGMMRAHMADPHIVRKLEAGESDRIRTCVGASYCINRLYRGLDALCIQNPATGREETIPHVDAADDRAAPDGSSWSEPGPAGPGGGPRRGRARSRGRPARGGVASPVVRSGWQPGPRPRRSDLIGIVDWLVVGVPASLGVDLRFDTVADGAGRSSALGPDVVVVATGGRPRTPGARRGRGPRRRAPGTSSAGR